MSKDAAAYGVRIERASPVDGKVWRAVRVEHLLPEQNKGRQNIFFRAYHVDGSEARDVLIEWTWEGKSGDQEARPVKLDKPPTDEYMGDLAMWPGMIITCWVQGWASDKVSGLSTNHADETGPNGEIWSSPGHHSFIIGFMEQDIAQPPDPGPPPPPTDSDIAADLQALRVQCANALVMLDAIIAKEARG